MTRSAGATVKDRMPQPRRRARIIWIGTLVVLVIFGVQLFNLQIVRGAELAEQGRIVRTRATQIDAPRGAILDANGQVLADTVKTYHIAVNQQLVAEYRHYEDGELVGTGPAEAARLLAPILGRDPSELGGQMIGDSTYVYLKKDVDLQTWRAIRALNIHGIEWEPSFERLYPAGSTAATVVGTVDGEGNGNSGLELTFNDLLVGVPGEQSYETGSSGAIMQGTKVTTKEAVPGATVHTSIHSDLQYTVQELLDEQVAKYGADWGAVVVQEIKTGRVLVLADSGQSAPEQGPQKSHAIQDVYEPGSVGKVLTFATALSQGTVTPYTEFEVPARMEVDGQWYRDFYDDHPTYLKTATGVLAMSSNTGTIKVGMGVSDDLRYQTFLDFGLGQPTGIELPGESGGILTPPETWDGRTRYVNMFGQGFAVNALQANGIVATIGNGGVWNQPHLVDGWTTADGLYHAKDVESPREVLRPEVADTLLTMMESVVAVDGGSGVLAQVEGYRIAAKTGTAEIIGVGVVPSMSGVVPTDDPQLAITALLYNPQADLTQAGLSVAPLFRSIVTESVRMLGIPPSSEPPRLFPSEPGESE